MSSPKKARRAQNPGGTTSATSPTTEPTSTVLWLPAALAISLFVLSFLPRIQQNDALAWSFRGAALCLLAWSSVLYAAGVKRSFSIALRPQHYIQAMVQLSLYLYWGFYFHPVYAEAWLIIGQLVFAYAFDILLTWSRRETYALGFGAFPIILSTNLFLWFKDDWFYMQFLLVAVGFMGKEFVRWRRDNKDVHIFNPSAFTLGLFSLILIVTNTSDLTWGQQIASTLTLAPHIYLFLFLIGLVVMYFFSITLIAGTAAATLFGLSAVYFAITGVPYFLDSEIPAAVFLGLHLLVTDPSTSPRTPPGKIVFGALYGVGVFALYSLLGALGAPTFYDKLLCVPLLNLSVIGIDRIARRWQVNVAPREWRWANPVHMAGWILFFGTMTALGKTDGMQTGDRLPFWEQACKENKTNACARLVKLESAYCTDHSAWACNELGLQYMQGTIVNSDTERAHSFFATACELRFTSGCVNLLNAKASARSTPHELDLRLLLRQRGQNLMEMPQQELRARACDHGWTSACDNFGSVQ